MKTSETITEIAKALAAASTGLKNVAEDSVNPHFRSGYASLGAIIAGVRPVLAEHGLSIIQSPEVAGNIVTCETTLIHESGEWISGTTALAAKSDQAQPIGSAITYARRYGLSALLCISSEADDDGNHAQGDDQRRPELASRAQTDRIWEASKATWHDSSEQQLRELIQATSASMSLPASNQLSPEQANQLLKKIEGLQVKK